MARGNHQISVVIFLFFLIDLSSHLLSSVFVDGNRILNTKDRALIEHKDNNTVVSDDGQLIDCVDIYKQPAFSHPLLKNHTIQMKPSSYPSGHRTRNLSTTDDELLQGWLKNGRCPEGTIPIIRTQKPDLIPRKTAAFISHKKRLNHSLASSLDENLPIHEYAQVSIDGGNYYGANAEINVWNPASLVGEFSIAQLWVMAGQDQDLNTVEAGWHVAPSGEKKTKLFVYWTADGYQSTGCYNLECPGFVQTSNEFAFNYEIDPISVYAGKQYVVAVTVHKDMQSGNWWLHYQGQDIGYWPGSMLTSLAGSATEINWGGEIINYKPQGHHTSTQMGSGHFPSEGPAKASFFRFLGYFDESGALKDPEVLTPFVTNSMCYDLQVIDKNSWGGVHFYFGGPGFSDKCP